ncbi:MAG: cupredoxin domain-containing protein [Chloroflexota bacterium]|nr:cupredoxin domain-containing protein [Chloroflexota bacterium]
MELTYGMAQRVRLATFSWLILLQVAALADLVVLLSMTIVNQDVLAIVLAGLILIGIGLLGFRGGMAGVVLLAGIFFDIAIYTVAGAYMNVLHGAGVHALFFPAFLAVASVTGFIAAVAAVIGRRNPRAGYRAAPIVGQAAIGLLVLTLGAGLVTADGRQGVLLPSDITLGSANMAYSQDELVVDEGEVTLTLSNKDLFWHTFTVDALDVDLRVPENGTRQVTFTAPPGTYEFYCAIPGHTLVGMRGTLVVRPAESAQ